MIVSASRRTDIPAFYGEWFVNCLRRGWVEIANPFNPRQQRVIELSPEKVEVIVFWSKYPAPFLKYLDFLDRQGYRYYFLLTLNPYPPFLEKGVPPLEERIKVFRRLSERVGKERVVWRYDPVIVGPEFPPSYHRENFASLAEALASYTERVVVSFLELYRRVKVRLHRAGLEVFDMRAQERREEALALAAALAEIAGNWGLEIFSCAEKLALSPAGIRPGACIDPLLVNRVFQLSLPYRKDPGQRRECLCTRAVDVGAYGTCRFGCLYCYGRNRYQRRDER